MKKHLSLYQGNIRAAQNTWGKLPNNLLQTLQELTSDFSLSVAAGDLLYLENKWYVTHSGLLRIARRHHCSGINVIPVRAFCDPQLSRWAFKATVYTSIDCRGFTGFGDADPSNVSPLVHGAEMRIAETRAVNRALRKAYGIGLCSVEELGSTNGRIDSTGNRGSTAPPGRQVATGNDQNVDGQRPLRDRLFAIIRQYELDPGLVKRYATDFCGTESLRQAGREQVEKFIAHLAESAARSREELAQQLDRYKEKEAA